MSSGDAEHLKRDRRGSERVAGDAPHSQAAARRSATLMERTTEWLTEVGAWIFGGLLALNLVLIASLLDVGPVDTEILIAICALGCALPVNVVGIILNRLVKDVELVETGEMVTALQSFRGADSSEVEALYPPPEERASLRRRRSTLALWWSLGAAALSGVLTVIGLVAALWHMAWWVGVAALVTATLSATLVAVVYLSTKPSESEASRTFTKRYVQRQTQQGLQRAKQESEQRKGGRAA
jgi:hypothetical protein